MSNNRFTGDADGVVKYASNHQSQNLSSNDMYRQDANGVKRYQTKQEGKSQHLNIESIGRSVAALVLGILSFVLGVIPAIVALVLSKGQSDGKAKAGRICAIITIALYILMVVAFVIMSLS